MIFEALLAGAVGGMLYLDKFQLLQSMVSRPMVAGPVLGWIMGDLSVGLLTGVAYEMFWLRTPPVGGFVPPDVTLASIATAAVAALLRSKTGVPPNVAVCLSFLFVFPFSFAGRRLDVCLRIQLGRLARKVEHALASGDSRWVFPYLVAGLAMGFLAAMAVLAPLILLAAAFLIHIYPLIPSPAAKALGFAFYAIPLLGVADMMVRMDERQDAILFLLGFTVAVVAVFVSAACS